VLVGGKY